jgi:hypothetical protein
MCDCLFSFGAFRIFSLFCVLSALIMMYLGVFIFGPVSLVFCNLDDSLFPEVWEFFCYYSIE